MTAPRETNATYEPLTLKGLVYHCDYPVVEGQPCWGQVKECFVFLPNTIGNIPEAPHKVMACEGHDMGSLVKGYKFDPSLAHGAKPIPTIEPKQMTKRRYRLSKDGTRFLDAEGNII